ncbi:unnamed protein product [Closterium sp. Naga37s-1]|nr:unnamed protein product [Closterium sp. Naga37s-1]
MQIPQLTTFGRYISVIPLLSVLTVMTIKDPFRVLATPPHRRAREWARENGPLRGPVVLCHVEEHSRGGAGACTVGHGGPDPGLYHMRIFHASHHLSPVPATAKQLADEVRAVKGVSMRLCPMRVSLDRVILTAAGALLACWQVVEGTDPTELRDELKEALPRAPKQQLLICVCVLS